MQAAVLTFEERLALPAAHRSKVVWRLDGGFGGDEYVDWLLQRDYQVLVKGCSNRRAGHLAAQVRRWIPVRGDKFVGRVTTPVSFCRPVDTFVLRWATTQGWQHAYLYSSLGLCGRQTSYLYDQRGGAETEFRTDKSGGLYLHQRRKHKRDAQEVWVLLTDMAHNYLAWFTRTILADSPFSGYGALRISRDLLRIPGYVEIQEGQLLSVSLSEGSPFTKDLLPCLARFWD